MKNKALIFICFGCVSVFLWSLPLFVFGEGDELRFLPPEPVFHRLIGDPREPQNALIANLTYPQFEGAIGPVLEFLQWRPMDGSRWGWGIQGASFIELDSLGNFVYPERASDWYLGMYFSEASGDFSHRFEYTHISSHLGDELFYEVPRIIYSREFFRWTTSFQASESLRIYAGLGCPACTRRRRFMAARGEIGGTNLQLAHLHSVHVGLSLRAASALERTKA